MIRRLFKPLLILLLIVGCEDEPKGMCMFITELDESVWNAVGLTFSESSSINFDSLFFSIQFKCHNTYTIDECCSAGYYEGNGENGIVFEDSLLNANSITGMTSCDGSDLIYLIEAYQTNNLKFPKSQFTCEDALTAQIDYCHNLVTHTPTTAGVIQRRRDGANESPEDLFKPIREILEEESIPNSVQRIFDVSMDSIRLIEEAKKVS